MWWLILFKTHHVEKGHTLGGISQKIYGDGSRYELIFAANANQIKNPNLIYPGPDIRGAETRGQAVGSLQIVSRRARDRGRRRRLSLLAPRTPRSEGRRMQPDTPSEVLSD